MSTTTTSPHSLTPAISDQIDQVFAQQQANRYNLSQTTARERIAKIKRVHKAILQYRSELHEAMYKDYRKNPAEVDLAEIYVITSEAKHAVAKLKKWMRPEKVATPMALLGSRSYIHYEARGTCLIVSPWNYPINLTFGPLISAIAAGNSVILKPSEFTVHTTVVMQRIIESLFEPNEVAMIPGDYTVGAALLEKPFDHIFFTGSPQVGKIVMTAAAKHLTSVTLELGGKSPVIVGQDADLKEAAKKIAWAKFLNNGQTCIAPDYVYVHAKDQAKFVELLDQNIKQFYGETATAQAASTSYCRIVNQKHFSRLNGMLENAQEMGAQVAVGGDTKADEHYIAPTVLTQVHADSQVMQEEIFGPLLPVLPYNQLSEALATINAKPKPLALYVYSRNGKTVNTILQNTSAGGTCINDSAIHYGQNNMPFGGVNNSGIGKSHGIYGFKSFSNERGVLKQPMKMSGVQFMYPPYNKWVQKMIDLTIKWL